MRRYYRAELAQRRVLEWLQTRSSIDGLADSHAASDFTGTLSREEIVAATQELVDRQYVKGQKQGNGEFYYLDIQSGGRAALRRSGAISTPAGERSSVTSISAHNYGDTTIGNQVVGGQGHTITANMASGISLEEALAAIAEVRTQVASAPVDADDRDDILEDIDGLLAKGARRGVAWLKEALRPLATQIATVYSKELANKVLEIGSSIVT